MSERLKFVQACLDRREAIVAICDRFGISEKTGHKYLRRFREAGLEGLTDRSHAPHRQPHRMSAASEARLVELRKRYPAYGPEKLRDWLVQNEGTTAWPSVSAIGALLKRRGLIRARRRPTAPAARAALPGRTLATAPNDVWTADFKGEFRLATGPYCYPLTVLDLHSHFLLRCTALPTTAIVPTQQTFTRLFREYGLPAVIRTDNGVPFAQPNAVGRFGALAFWWVRLGIRPEHITPGRPAENGAHERFHKTLKAAATRPASPSLGAQQRRFDRFQAEYNTDRPHAALPAHRPPAQSYEASPRPYPARLPTIVYPSAASVRRVTRGFIKWRNLCVFLSSNLTGEYVGLFETASDLITVAYATLALGDLDPHAMRFIPRVRWLG